jgi:hypothetical protein
VDVTYALPKSGGAGGQRCVFSKAKLTNKTEKNFKPQGMSEQKYTRK